MRLDYRKAQKKDAELLINIYNAAFYDDYIKYGECPAYGRSIEAMENSIEMYPKLIVNCENVPVGVISVERKGVTPADKKENIKFYTGKCGFHIVGTEMDGNVKAVTFLMER